MDAPTRDRGAHRLVGLDFRVGGGEIVFESAEIDSRDGVLQRLLVEEFQPIIKADKLALFNATTDEAKAAAKALLDADLALLKEQLTPLKAELETDTATARGIREQIKALIEADTDVIAARAKLEADKATLEATLKAGREQLAADVQKLKDDIAALLAAPTP